MSEDTRVIIIALIILAIIVFGIQWLLVRFIDWSLALIATGIIAYLISFIYVSLSHATPNGAGYNIVSSEYLNSFALVYFVFTFGFCLACYLSKHSIPKKAYFIALIPTVLIFIRYIVLYIYYAVFYKYDYQPCKSPLCNYCEVF